MDLSKNNLGSNTEDLKYLGQGIKKLPNNLSNLELDLNNNDDLGQSSKNLKHLA